MSFAVKNIFKEFNWNEAVILAMGKCLMCKLNLLYSHSLTCNYSASYMRMIKLLFITSQRFTLRLQFSEIENFPQHSSSAFNHF